MQFVFGGLGWDHHCPDPFVEGTPHLWQHEGIRRGSSLGVEQGGEVFEVEIGLDRSGGRPPGWWWFGFLFHTSLGSDLYKLYVTLVSISVPVARPATWTTGHICMFSSSWKENSSSRLSVAIFMKTLIVHLFFNSRVTVAKVFNKSLSYWEFNVRDKQRHRYWSFPPGNWPGNIQMDIYKKTSWRPQRLLIWKHGITSWHAYSIIIEWMKTGENEWMLEVLKMVENKSG